MRDPIWRIRPAAEDDLRQIWQHGSSHWGQAQADSYLDALFALFKLLAGFPEMARLRPEFTPQIRIHPSGMHLVLYRESDLGGIEVIRILHAHQNLRDFLAEA